MIRELQIFWAVAACGTLSAVALMALGRLRSCTRSRERQLDEAAGLLSAHVDALDRLLVDPAVPKRLKGILMMFSDAIADRDTVCTLAQWLAARPFGEPVSAEGVQEVANLVGDLRGRHPDLADLFSVAVNSGIAGACLRWAETAVLFEQMTSKMAATPRTEMAIAATVRTLRQNFRAVPATFVAA